MLAAVRADAAGADIHSAVRVQAYVRHPDSVQGLQLKEGDTGQPLGGLQELPAALQLLLVSDHLKEHADDQPAEPGDRIPHSDHAGIAS